MDIIEQIAQKIAPNILFHFDCCTVEQSRIWNDHHPCENDKAVFRLIANDAHSVIAGKVAELEDAVAQAKACLGSGFGDHPIEAIRESNINRAWHLLDAALAPRPVQQQEDKV